MPKYGLTFTRNELLDGTHYAVVEGRTFERDVEVVTEDAELVRKLTANKSDRKDVYDQYHYLHFAHRVIPDELAAPTAQAKEK